MRNDVLKKSIWNKRKISEKEKRQNGITLIALIITIIVLLILAGVTISTLTGENGLITKAQQAALESKYAGAAEKVALAVSASYDTTGKLKDNYLKDNLNRIDGIKEPVEKIEYDLKAVVDGFEFTISELGIITGKKDFVIADLPENTPQNPQDAGKEVALKDGWGTQNVTYVKTSDGTEVKTLETVATVYAVSVGSGDTVPVPKGFYYVGGTKNSGVVISDDERDKNKFVNYTNTTDVPKGIPSGAVYNSDGTLKTTNLTDDEKSKILYGNQFVWIQCSANDYKKCNVWNGTTQTTTTLGNASWETSTGEGEITYIEKYGGFYIGRYEAGTSNLTSSTINFATGYGVKPSNWQNTDFRSENITSGKITCKAGEIPYYHADYTTAKIMTKAMYATDNERKNSVHSGLVTGTMWDVTLNYFKAQDSTLDLKNTAWGNYTDTTLTNCKGRYIAVDSSNGVTSDIAQNTDGARHYGVMTCGSTEDVKKCNIYDMAGNLWEWTEEIAYDLSNDYYMLRGRCLQRQLRL